VGGPDGPRKPAAHNHARKVQRHYAEIAAVRARGGPSNLTREIGRRAEIAAARAKGGPPA
jgi:hypothetical protein